MHRTPAPARVHRLAHQHRLLLGAAALLSTAIGVQAQRGPGPGPGPNGPQPVANLTLAERQAFEEGVRTFGKDYSTAEGLGPVFNDESCAACHRAGGDSNRNVTRIGRLEDDRFDDLERLGGSLLQSRGIGTVRTVDGTFDFRGEDVPAEAAITARRKSQPLFGLGFVDAVPDATFHAIAEEQLQTDPATAGRVQLVFDRTTGDFVAGRFGWKAQVPTLREFSGDALLNEMGITSPGFRDEICPQGDCLALGFNPAPALNDDGRDAEALTDFMRMLAPPPPGETTDATRRGETQFQAAGCAVCHRPSLQTGPSPLRALDRATFQPYSDFLLHDMGPLGDGIPQAAASGAEMRTAPLWGLRFRTRYLHDGSAASVDDAIRRHGGQGRTARLRYEGLTDAERADLLAFLQSR